MASTPEISPSAAAAAATSAAAAATSAVSEVAAVGVLANLGTPVAEDPVVERPGRLNDNSFAKGVYCEFRAHKLDPWYCCQVVETVAKAGLKAEVTVQPCTRYGDGNPIPLTVPKKFLRAPGYCVTDTVQVLDDRPEIPDKENDYWYVAENVEIIQNRRALPSYVVLPVNGQEQITVPGNKVRPNQFYDKGDYWSTGPSGPTKIEHDILNSPRPTQQKHLQNRQK